MSAVYRGEDGGIPPLPRPGRAGAGGSGRGALTAATAWYTALWPQYTAGDGADGGLWRRNELERLRTEERGSNGVTGCRGWDASRSSR
jgi:hypothetical protein